MQNKTSNVKKLTMQALSIIQMHHSFSKSNDIALIPSKLNPYSIAENPVHNANQENVEEQQEFSFSCNDSKGTLIFADEIFDNGKIRSTFATFDQSLIFTTTHDNDTLSLQPPLKKLFVVEKLNNCSSQSKGISKCNDTSQKMTMVKVEASNNKYKKSKSTGFSKTWRFRENLKLQSNSDGQDIFVFLNPSRTLPMKSNEAKEESVVSKKVKGGKCKTTLSPHEKFYVMNRKRKENSKQKSFLPYKKDLIGFFTNINGFSRNLNPF